MRTIDGMRFRPDDVDKATAIAGTRPRRSVPDMIVVDGVRVRRTDTEASADAPEPERKTTRKRAPKKTDE